MLIQQIMCIQRQLWRGIHNEIEMVWFIQLSPFKWRIRNANVLTIFMQIMCILKWFEFPYQINHERTSNSFPIGGINWLNLIPHQSLIYNAQNWNDDNKIQWHSFFSFFRIEFYMRRKEMLHFPEAI